MNLERFYLDYNATSPLSESVNNWLKSGDLVFANPSSQHLNGKASRKVINHARAQIYKTFNQNETLTKLYFHSGATESFHAVAYSFSEMARLQGKDLLICFSKIDHPAVTSLGEKYLGPHVKVYELKRDKELRYLHQDNLDYLRDKKENNPDLIILYHHLWVHNETGFVSDMNGPQVFKTLKDLYIHVDAVQAPGKIEDWNRLEVADIWTFSGHKFGALKGVGFTFLHGSVPFYPFISGGGQQGNLRSGTENVTGIQSLALALKDLDKISPRKTLARRKILIDLIKKQIQGIGVVLDTQDVASNTIYFCLYGLSSDITLALFDLNGLEISAGSACSSGAAKDSVVLLQMGLGPYAKNGLRLSMPLDMDDIFFNKLSQKLIEVLGKLPRS